MRVFILLLIMAIGFSGFAAIAHAHAPSADQVVVSVVDGDCVSDVGEHAQHDDGAKACTDCGHCCTAHVFFVPFKPASFTAFIPVFSMSYNENPDGNVILGLERPPKHLV